MTASNILDRGASLLNGTYCATPMGAAGKGFHVGSTGNASGSPVCRDVVNGAIAATLGGVAAGPLQLADTSLSAPANFCYAVTIRDANGAYVLGGPLSGYTCVQPAANNSWCAAGVGNWDLYLPTIPNLPLGQSLETLTVGTLYVTTCVGTGCGSGSGGGGSMTWPDGTASGIPNYSYPRSWGTTYNASTPVPANFISNLDESQVTNLVTDLSAKEAHSALATVAESGRYTDLFNKPTIPAAQIQSDWTQANTALLDYIKNKPTIPAAQVQTDWNAVSGLGVLLNKPSIPAGPPYTESDITSLTTDLAAKEAHSALATVAETGSYNDLSSKPTIPAAQIGASFIGVPANGQIILLIPLTFAVTVPTGCPNSYLDGLVAVTGSTTFTMYYLTGGIGGTPTSFGTAVIASGHSATFTCSSYHTFAAGDYLEVKDPSTADATFANIGFGLYGVR